MTHTLDYTRNCIVENAFAALVQPSAYPSAIERYTERVKWARTTDAATAEWAANPRKLTFEQLDCR